MKKLVVALFLLLGTTTIFAQHCPDPSQVYRKENNVVIPVAPAGWRISWKHKLEATNIQFAWAAWAEKRIDPEDEQKVLCIYGNPDVSEHGLILTTINRVDKSLIKNHSQWHGIDNDDGDAYFRCEATNQTQCPFG